jgi:hypothetical protein
MTGERSDAAPPIAAGGRRRWVFGSLAFVLGIAAGFGIMALPLAFTTSIHPPAPVSEPVTVFVLRVGRTSSILIPHEGRTFRYAYGDWNYYALRNTSAWDGARAMLLPTRGALGRRVFDGELSAAEVHRELDNRFEQLHSLAVERKQAGAVVAELERIVSARQETAVETPAVSFTFVHHPQRYTYWHNSNHKVEEWLRQLGCVTEGPAYNANWRVVHEGS